MSLKKYWRDNFQNTNTATKLTVVLLIIYLIALVWILVFKLNVRFSYMESRGVNLIPFNDPLIFGEMILNAIIFMPLGIYAGILLERWNFWKNLLFFFLVSLVIEAVQFTMRIGAFDVTDISTNSLGGLTGLVVFTGIEKISRNRARAHKIVNVMATMGTVVMISFLLLLKLKMLPVRYQ